MSDSYLSLFAKALKTGDASDLAPYLEKPDQLNRFAVYRNNVVRGAIEALRSAYPTVDRLVGENFFSPLAMAYWDANPPNTPSLSLYGSGFPDHIEHYGPANNLPYLKDVARHDRAWLEAHHAVDQAVFDPTRAAMMVPEDLPGLVTGLHASVSLLASNWPSYDIWRGNRYDLEPPRINLIPQTGWSMIWRDKGEVQHCALSQAEHAFYQALQNRKSIEQAAEAGQSHDNQFDAGALFGAALTTGILGG